MAWDQHSLFAYGVIASVTSQASNILIIVLQAGQGARFSIGQQVTLGPAQTLLTINNAMVGRITDVTLDTLTIDYSSGSREGSNVQTILTGYVVGNGNTPKIFTDIEAQVDLAIAKALKSATTNVDVSDATAPSAGQVLTAVNSTHATWQAAAGGSWIADANTWTYSATDGHTFVVTINADVTGSIGIGDRIWLTNQAASQYFIVTKISVASSVTTLTMYGGTNYSITNTAITAPNFSHVKTPFGFNIDPSIWTESFSDGTSQSQATPTNGNWYNVGTGKLDLPIGAWDTYYEATLEVVLAAPGQCNIFCTLATTNNTESDTTMTCAIDSNSVAYNSIPAYRRRTIVVTAKTTYYLNAKNNGGAASTMYFRGDYAKTMIKAVCAYL